jgi:hypothetical protein
MQLHRHDGVGLQSESTQFSGERGDRTVRLSEAQGARRAVGEIFAIRRIGEGKRVGMAR